MGNILCYLTTYMAVGEHGKPYNTQNNHYTLDDILKGADEINNNARTLMVVPEHGQPYNKYKYVTRMAIREHGQRYKYNEK